MTVGEKKTVDVSPEEGYGQYDPNLLLELPLNTLPDDITPKKGMQLRLMNKQGQSIPVSVSDVKEESVQLDANHPLAGKILTFDIELINII
jgi:peptidylprolyl isomerase